MNRSRLPPLQTLIAFEASVRLGSFTRAAEELALTQGAISQHIRALEGWLGRRLFVRTHHGAEPTGDARDLALQVRQGLGILHRAFHPGAGMASGETVTVVTMSTLPALHQRWLSPRLEAFRRRHPRIDPRVRADARLARLDGRDGVDVALRYGPGHWPGLDHYKLAEERVFPVLSPHYREGRPPRRRRDLAGCVLLHHSAQPWELWFQAAGLAMEVPAGPRFTDLDSLLEAAVNGEGVALARHALVHDDLAAGRLIQPWKTSARDVHAYYLVWRPGGAKNEAIQLLLAWLREAFAALHPPLRSR